MQVREEVLLQLGEREIQRGAAFKWLPQSFTHTGRCLPEETRACTQVTPSEHQEKPGGTPVQRNGGNSQHLRSGGDRVPQAAG